MQATSSRATVHRSDSLEITARGVAAGAALSVGLIESLDVYRGLWRSAHKVEPGEALFLDMAYEAWCRAAERA
jgi:glycerol kinase